MNIEQTVRLAYEAIEDKQGENTKILRIGKISSLAEYFLITSASNERQVKAIADNIESSLEEKGSYVRSKEGMSTSNWILLDYGDFMIHVFKTEEREFYNLERLWKDAPYIEASDL